MRDSGYLTIIPCYNEEDTIEEVATRALVYTDVCVVDDCSTDRTPDILAGIAGIHVIRHERNTHIARGILDGMAYALGREYRYAITMDAGLSHNPDELPRFLAEGEVDLVFGRRDTKTGAPLFRRALSRVGNLIYNVSLDFPRLPSPYYGDLTTGYRRFSRPAMEALLAAPMKSRSFDFIFESASVLYKAGMTFSEVPITYDFTNSSLNSRVVADCLKMVARCAVGK